MTGFTLTNLGRLLPYVQYQYWSFTCRA